MLTGNGAHTQGNAQAFSNVFHHRYTEGGLRSQVAVFVGADVEFKGTIRCHDTLRIDGKVEGDIHTDGTVLIGKDALITGNIFADSVICEGMIVGDIVAGEEVQLLASASLDGTVRSPVLTIDEGVLFNDRLETTYVIEDLPDEEAETIPSARSRTPLKLVSGMN